MQLANKPPVTAGAGVACAGARTGQPSGSSTVDCKCGLWAVDTGQWMGRRRLTVGDEGGEESRGGRWTPEPVDSTRRGRDGLCVSGSAPAAPRAHRPDSGRGSYCSLGTSLSPATR